MAKSEVYAPGQSIRSKDWLRQPMGMMFWWGIPIALGMSTNFLHLSLTQTALTWAGAFAWMGTGCALNALRCGRRHCFFSGPVLWLGAVAAVLAGFGVISGPHMLNDVINATVVLVILSYVPEWIRGRYTSKA
jgi:hypothetical protein